MRAAAGRYTNHPLVWPARVRGRLSQTEDLLVLRVDPAQIERRQPPPSPNATNVLLHFVVAERAVSIAVEASEEKPVLEGAKTGVRGRRIHFVDLLRLLASLQMVHGHTIDALLAEELRQGTFYDRWSWGRGLVSVGFMVAAGISFHLSTLARFEQHVSNAATVRRRFRRGIWLVILGYLLHLPAGMDVAAWHEFQIADVLQCIGICILVLEAITVSVKNPRHVVYAAFVMAVIAFTVAPLGEQLDPNGPWRFAVNYVTHTGGSLFPLAPWAGYVMVGVVVAELALPKGTRTAPGFPLPRLIACAAAMLAIAGLAELSPWSLVIEETSRNAHPAFNLTKLGVVLAIVALLALLGTRIQKMPRFLEVLAGESLILYVFHLLFIYGAGVGLYRLIGHTLPFWTAFWVAAGMVLLTGSVGLFWFRAKKWSRQRGLRNDKSHVA